MISDTAGLVHAESRQRRKWPLRVERSLSLAATQRARSSTVFCRKVRVTMQLGLPVAHT